GLKWRLLPRRFGLRWSYKHIRAPAAPRHALPGRGCGPRRTPARTVRYHHAALLDRLRLHSPDRDAVALHARIEGAAGDAEKRGRFGLVPLRALQRLLDEPLLDLIQAQAQRQKLGGI